MVLKIPNTTNTSVGEGAGPAPESPLLAKRSKGEWPDRKSPNDQRNYGDDLVAGVKGPGLNVNGKK